MIQNFTYTERAYIALSTVTHLMNLHGLYYLPVAHRLLCSGCGSGWIGWRYETAKITRDSICRANHFITQEHRHRNTRCMLGMEG